MKIEPILDNIIIFPQKEEAKTESGIILPDSIEKEKPQIGKVVAVGPGKISAQGESVKMQVKKGDTVLFSKYSPQEVKLEGKEYLILKEDEILAIIK
jgi:chaperonin GroES